jgi:CRISPR-associated RAMP protein (TIGR02581 family)
MTDWTVTIIDLAFETVGGLRVGSGVADDVTDAPLLRDADDEPFVPGSSLKGVLRSSAERLLRAYDLNPPVCDVLTDERCGGKPGAEPLAEEDLARLCWVCQVFGSPHQAGRISVGDLRPSEPVTTVVRDGVAIDRGELRAAGSLKYDYEVMAPSTRLAGTIRVEDAADHDLGILLGLLDLFDAGVLSLGGGTSRGLGQVRYAHPPHLRRFSAAAFTPGTGGDALDADTLREAAQRWLQAGGR